MPPDHTYQDHRARYSAALDRAQLHLRQLLESDPTSWKPISSSSSSSSSSNKNNNSRHFPSAPSDISLLGSNQNHPARHILTHVDPAQVRVEKRPHPGGPDVLRATLDVRLDLSHTGYPRLSAQVENDLLESFQVVLRAPELRPLWDKFVEQASLLEIVDPSTRVSKTDYRLGWPASPRDTITISKTIRPDNSISDSSESSTQAISSAPNPRLSSPSSFLIDVSTSLPRFADEPSFLRPCPPYVRTQVGLLAWVLQILPINDSSYLPTQETTTGSSTPSLSPSITKEREQKKLRITLYWNWNLNRFPTSNGNPISNSSTNPYQAHLSNLLVSLVSHVRSSSSSASLSYPTSAIGTSTSTTGGGGSANSNSTSNPTGNSLARIPNLRNWTAGSTSVPSLPLSPSSAKLEVETPSISALGTESPSGRGGGIEMIREQWDEASLKWSSEWNQVFTPSLSTSIEGETKDGSVVEDRAPMSVGNLKGKGKGRERIFVDIGLPIPALPSTQSSSSSIQAATTSSASSGSGTAVSGKDGWDVRIQTSNQSSPPSGPLRIPSNRPSISRNNTNPKNPQQQQNLSTDFVADDDPFAEPKYHVQLFSSTAPDQLLPAHSASTTGPISSTLPPPVGTALPMPSTSAGTSALLGRYTLRIVHSELKDRDGLERYKVEITRLVGGKGVRVNGALVVPIEAPREGLLQDKVENEEIIKWRNVLETTSTRYSDPQPGSTNLSITTASPSNDRDSDNSSAISLRSTNSTSTSSTVLSPKQASSLASSQISNLLRRSYIYFLSLLQEPPAKWKPMIDSSSGVTITQLLSPDPTLTIYRAEAVFVGVGVWDVFASVLSGWGKSSWDKSIEDSRLVRMGTIVESSNAGELSEVWWEKRKGNWPVAPRDSVTLRTCYKSPTSIHIFSFSTDDTNLFPSIPSVQPPTIRTQTDLSGWSIEALSPTTTSITLLDQSDPKGWSNKSGWTPQQLIAAVSGVRDFAIKFGAPPVVTRLNGARKTAVGFDHEKGMFRVEYELVENLSTSEESGAGGGEGSETSTIKSNQSTIHSISSSTSKWTNQEPIELELRCDVSVWSPQGLELMIDPPPSSVSCLSRHRLSSTGGGLWLTIEHPPLIVRESTPKGKVNVTIRKASKNSTDKGGVLINGARVKVDIEVLAEDKIRELEGRKRRKFSPVPLDQYETLGARAWATNHGGTSAMGGSDNKSVTDSTIADGKKDKETLATTSDGEEKRKLPSVASIDSTSEVAPTSAPDSVALPPATNDSNLTKVRGPLEPPAAALEALAYLQSFHAEQGPELTDPAPGWSIVSERAGTVVRKKVIPRISETIPVYRGDKIVQGLTADEIASVVTSTGCRKTWDERVDQATTLSSYGNGVSTLAISTKPAFPFKGRIFYVSTVTASVKVPSASSTSSTSTVLFVASASYVPTSDPESPEPNFDPVRVNPNSLLTGQILLEGWILETLDPYSSSVLAIPSTRCTHVACIDQKGSVPLALNQVLNANLAKSISNVESFGKLKGPIPRIWLPSNGVQIEGPLSEDAEGDCMWKLGKVTGNRSEGETNSSKVVVANFGEEENTFKALFRVGGGSASSSSSNNRDDDDGPSPREKPYLATKGSSLGTTLLKSELPRSASLNFGTAAPPILHKSSATSELSHKRSRGSLRAKSPAAPPVATGGASPSTPSSLSSGPSASTQSSSLTTTNDPNANDLVVAEFIVDLKQYPHGYSVLANSSVLSSTFDPTSSSYVPGSALSLDPLPPKGLAPSSASAPVLPLRLTAHDAPLPSILTASLDAWKRANHLVRVLVPTSSITHPVQDPLRDPSKTRVEKPEWFRLLTEGNGALVEIKISPLPAPTSASITTNDGAKPNVPSSSTGGGFSGAVEPTGLGKVTGQANRTVMFNRERITVMSQKESRTVLARFEDEDAPLQGVKLSRIPRRKRKSTSTIATDFEATHVSTLPIGLQKPLAIATRLLAPPKPSTPITENGDFEFPDPKSPGMMTPAAKDSGSPVMSKSGSLQPASSRRGTNSSESTPLTGPLSAILGSYPLARLGSSIVNVTNPSTYLHQQHHSGVMTTDSGDDTRRIAVTTRQYSLGFVVSIALIAFLLGSFLRSLLSPADYIIYHPPSTASLNSAPPAAGDSVEKALLTAFDPHRHWREAKRLLELRTGFGGLVGWDLIIAAVKRE